MKNIFAILPISLAAFVAASPLGDRAVFHKVKNVGVPRVGARRYILQSRVDSPPACVALASTPSNATTFPGPDLSNTTIPSTNISSTDNSTFPGPDLSNTTIPSANASSADNSTIPSAVNSTSSDPTGLQDNSTSTTNSSSAANTTTVSTRSPRLVRIAQDDLPDIAQHWQDLCLASGGDIFTNEPCVNLAGVNGINALLATADPCDQQDNADAMIVFAKSPGVTNSEALIAAAIAYRQHPRNTMNILGVVPSTMYCQKAPQSQELVGVTNTQLDGVDPGLYGSPSIPIVPFGEPGTCPFGQTPDVSTCSCLNGADTSATNSTDTSASDGTDTSAVNGTASAAASDSSTATDSLVASGSTSDVSGSTATDSATSLASAAATDVSSGNVGASTTPALTAPPAATTTAKSSGINFQPTDISGDVNDIDG
ncbi:hypothetical protein BD779DRAFT_197018 [Infundibulicybe gibba]|nr:hypothetical protein BD779DRAFT_197018 [Infundibulicybe gibba]